eukprot:scaffold60745_cov31-Prasinocladus_malaysianus.AAC.1
MLKFYHDITMTKAFLDNVSHCQRVAVLGRITHLMGPHILSLDLLGTRGTLAHISSLTTDIKTVNIIESTNKSEIIPTIVARNSCISARRHRWAGGQRKSPPDIVTVHGGPAGSALMLNAVILNPAADNVSPPKRYCAPRGEAARAQPSRRSPVTP